MILESEDCKTLKMREMNGENAPYPTMAQLWDLLYLPRGRHSFVPVHKLITPCIFGPYNDSDGEIERMLVIPITQKLAL